MKNLSAQCILEVWEQGMLFPAESRSQALLSLVKPDLSAEALSQLVLGERNVNLLKLRQRLFGPILPMYIECNKCGEALDLEISIDDFGFADLAPIAERHSISFENITARIRLPNSDDLAALASVSNIEEGRHLLFSRCVLELHRENASIAINALNEIQLNHLDEAIAKLDPRMEILLEMQCPQCKHAWQSLLDIGSFLWSEYDTYARQLLDDVHTLASCYNWSEKEILALSQHRRQYYLQRIMQ